MKAVLKESYNNSYVILEQEDEDSVHSKDSINRESFRLTQFELKSDFYNSNRINWIELESAKVTTRRR